MSRRRDNEHGGCIRRFPILWLLSKFFQALPLRWGLALGRLIGLVWYYLVPIRRGVALRNIRDALGGELSPREQRRAVRRCFQNLGMYAVEILRLPTLTRAECEARIERRAFQPIHDGLALGKGVIVVTAHIGNWDLCGCSQAILGIPLSIIFKDIKWKPAQRFWMRVRERTGINPIAPRRSKEDIRAALARNDVMVFIVDQHMAAHRSIVCSFFGRLASTTPAPVRFALETGAPIVPAAMYRDADPTRHYILCEPFFALETPYDDIEANVQHNTERLNRVIEKLVRRDPSQWLWLHRRWKVHENPEGWSVPPELRGLVDKAGTS